MIPFMGGTSYDVCGKAALITGAGQGIGLALARELHDRGALLTLVDVNARALAEFADELGSERVLTLTADVADRALMSASVAKATAHFGRLDVVVANAGVTPPPATLRIVDLDAFDRVIAINQAGVWNTVRPALEQIIASKGHVVVVSSVAAFAPGLGGASYMMSKAAVEQLGRALRLELAAHGASAGVAYFGVVDTALAHQTLDDDPLGNQIGRLLPWPLSQRISPEHAAKVLADGIARRAARTIAPSTWLPYALLRGAANVLVDARLAQNKHVHELLGKVEQRSMPVRGREDVAPRFG